MADRQPAPAGGAFSKRHVSGMLKFLDDEQRAKALEVAAAYKKRFAGKDWEPVLAGMRQVAEEDHLRIVRRRPARLLPAGRAHLTTSVSATSGPKADVKTPPAGLPRASTASSLLPLGRSRAPSTPRERWDVTSRGPATPLSPTPTGNAFAEGGFWEHITPKTPAPQTPTTATLPPPYSPFVPDSHEARTAYFLIKGEAEAMARTICASRMSAHSTTSNSDHIPNSLLTPRDLLKGAAITLQYRQVPLEKTIKPKLPELLKNITDAEDKIIDEYRLKDEFELLNRNIWLQIEEKPLSITTIYDKQRELTHMHRHRRKSSLLELSEQAVQQAWATRILEDAERVMEAEGDASDDSDGYNYDNFLRSIKDEFSSSSDLSSMVGARSYTDLASLRSSASHSDGVRLSRETTQTHRSSASPRKPPHDLPLRSRGNSASSNPSPGKRTRSRGLSRITTHIKEEIAESLPSAQLSPEDRAFRRNAASQTDLTNWAHQLREMDRVREESKGSFVHHPALRKRGNSSASSDSWVCVAAAKQERERAVLPSADGALTLGLKPPASSPRSSFTSHAKSQPTVTTVAQPTSPLLNFPYPIPAPPGFRYAGRGNASPTMQTRQGRQQGQSRDERSEVEEKEGYWARELARMESKEQMRQAEEREKEKKMREERGLE